MKNRTLSPYFRGMTLEEAWNGSFNLLLERGMPEKQIRLLKEICSYKFHTTRKIYDFLSMTTDHLFMDIYGTGKDGIYTYPFVRGVEIPEGIKEVRGPIGTQTSQWHQETLREHVCIVADRANCSRFGFVSSLDREAILLIAVLHDIGKKYTAATNEKGEICFRNHAEVSAFIAGHILRNFRDSDETRLLVERRAKEIVAIIYGHMHPVFWREDRASKKRFFEEVLEFFHDDYGRAGQIMSIVEDFSNYCDKGIQRCHPEGYKSILRASIDPGESFITLWDH